MSSLDLRFATGFGGRHCCKAQAGGSASFLRGRLGCPAQAVAHLHRLCQAAAGSLDPRKRVAFEVRRVRSEDGGYPHFYEHLDIERPLGRS